MVLVPLSVDLMELYIDPFLDAFCDLLLGLSKGLILLINVFIFENIFFRSYPCCLGECGADFVVLYNDFSFYLECRDSHFFLF